MLGSGEFGDEGGEEVGGVIDANGLHVILWLI